MGSCASKDSNPPISSSSQPATTSKKRQDQQQNLANANANSSQKNDDSLNGNPVSNGNGSAVKSSTGNGAVNNPHPSKNGTTTKNGATAKIGIKNGTTNGAKNGTSTPNETGLTQSSNDGNNPNNSINNSTSNSDKFVKVLLLGSGESGKSTIVKQMKILHQNGYTKEELQEYKPFVYRNLLECIKNIINAIMDLEPQLISDKKSEKLENGGTNNEDDDESSESSHDGSLQIYEDGKPASRRGILDSSELQKILEYDLTMSVDETFDPQVARLIIKVYHTPEVQQFLKYNVGNFYLIDLSKYFLSDVERIAQPDYFPSIPDILRTRKKTSGIYDFKFQMGKSLNIHMFDVGGQRSERKKWIHCFDNVTLIIFCVALSEYDQVLLEENTQNRLEESLTLFDSVVNSRWFLRSSIVLFLNKIDVFAEKLPYSPLENHFPDYNGGDNVNKAAKYILWRFTQVNRSGLNIYPHVTQATDTSNIELVFAAVKETILENSLRDSGLL